VGTVFRLQLAAVNQSALELPSHVFSVNCAEALGKNATKKRVQICDYRLKCARYIVMDSFPWIGYSKLAQQLRAKPKRSP